MLEFLVLPREFLASKGCRLLDFSLESCLFVFVLYLVRTVGLPRENTKWRFFGRRERLTDHDGWCLRLPSYIGPLFQQTDRNLNFSKSYFNLVQSKVLESARSKIFIETNLFRSIETTK
eukprot:GHVP01026711.1.p1 GENE.GHVP01026711.1~~GHVP01026711.1.p1  ORF type:complete len:119 (-),score=10.45 GHVP01026711.1:230-586(-)